MCKASCKLALLVVVLWATASGVGRTQIQYFQGQNVAPVFEGWERNPDSSISFVFGYMNRNYEEALNIPIGAENNIQPGGPDRGQPTHFYPRRTQKLFKVTVPKEWDRNQRLVWTLTAHGRTDSAKAWMQPEWEIETGLKTREGEANQPPTITGSNSQTIASRTVNLTATATDDGLPKPSRRASTPPPIQAPVTNNGVGVAAAPPDSGLPTGRLGIKWIEYRGPGNVTFSATDRQATDIVKPTVTLDTTVTFSQPGAYLLWAIGRDGLTTTVHPVTVTVTGTP